MTAPVKTATSSSAPTTARAFPTVFSSLQREIDRLFDDFASNGHHREVAVSARMDLAETKDGMELTIELPGLEEKDVKIEVTDGVLTVSGEKSFESKKEEKSYRFVERGYGSFSRSIELPAGAKVDDIKADLDKGVLTIRIPTAAKPAAKTIPVQPKA